MAVKNLLYLILICTLGVLVTTGGVGCANIIAPTGGPRDSLPPELLGATPRDSTLNFRENRITFYFNEYLTLENIQENLIVSPTPKVNPVVEFRLRTVTVRIRDTLEPNTTYSLNFGNALRDINEGNVLKDFTYVFSTGNALDRNQFSGRVLLAETGKADSTLTVVLHRNAADSAVTKDRPRYIAKVDRNGAFTFSNLAPGTFYAYALKDEGGTRRYLSKAQLFGFLGRPVAVSDTTPPVTMYAYVEEAEPPKRPSASAASPKEKAAADKRLVFTTNLDGGQQDLLQPFMLQFANPLRLFDTTQVHFTTGNFQPLGAYRFIPDSTNKNFSLPFTWVPDSTYNLVIEKNFAEDSAGRKILKTDTITFKTRKEADYGGLRLRFSAIDLSRNPVLQLVQSEKVIYSKAFTGNDFYQRLIKPGDYEIRILYDNNRNGKWDPGVFTGLHRQPEIVQSVNQTVTVKGNFERTLNITL